MKKLVVLMIAIAFVVSVMPALADQGASPAPAKSGEKSLFQLMGDSMTPGTVKEKNKYRKVEKIYLFQSLSDGIKQGSAKAKSESLRTQK